LEKCLLSAQMRNGRGIFITFALNQDHVSFLIVRCNRRILTFSEMSVVTNKIIGSKAIMGS
jgi:hypothetical protein